MAVETSLVLQLVNLALSGGLFLIAVRVEHRFTKLETQMQVVMHRLRLSEE